MDRKSSPESKLLEIIRKGGSSKILGSGRVSLERTLARSKDYLRLWLADPLPRLPGLFAFLTGLTLLAGLWDILGPHKANSITGNRKIAEESFEFNPSARQPLKNYLSAIEKRNLFGTVNTEPSRPKPAAPVTAPPPPVHVPTLAELASDLTLVGVINSGEPQAIILNRKSQKTYYLTAGESIGELKITKIRDNRVTLGRNDETLDLSM